MKNNKVTSILLILSAAVFLFGTGYKAGEIKNAKSPSQSAKEVIINPFLRGNSTAPKEDVDLSMMWEVWDLIEKKYVDKSKIDKQKMVYGAIKGVAASLEDPYTFFLTPEENQQSKEDLNGKFEGIGAQLGLDEQSNIIIIAPLKESPAEAAGAKAGDIISKVNNKSTQGLTLAEAVKMIRGPKGTKVTLEVIRGGKKITLDITRDEIRVPSIELEFKDDVAILKLNQFGEGTNDEWDKSVKSIAAKWKNKEIRGMILDLRDNPGGYLEGAVYIASEFLPYGNKVVKQESTIDGQSRQYEVSRKGKLLDIPIAVLINRGSASAAEIVSGALRDYKRAKLVGEKSFGKGSVQEAIDLDGNAGLHITVAKWILPKGDWINKKGIEPEIKIEISEEQAASAEAKIDIQLEKAIDSVLK